MNNQVAEALALLKAAANPSQLKGKLYLSNTNFLLLAVPNAIGRGAFNALAAPGAALPPAPGGGAYSAHITVMRPEEVEKVGARNITERGRDFSYSVGSIRDFNPQRWPGVNRCWVLEVSSPELSKLRRSYGLSSLPDDRKFHITFAVRRSGVLGSNAKSKATDTNSTTKPLTWDKPGTQVVKTSSDALEVLRNKAMLTGSRGRARQYGRPEPEGRDYDRIVFTDDPEEQQSVTELLRKLEPQGYRMKERPGGFLTATSPDEDISVYPNSKWKQIQRAWALQEQGVPKDEAWAQVERESKQAGAACPACGGAIIEIAGHTQCSKCGRICESCCEGGHQTESWGARRDRTKQAAYVPRTTGLSLRQVVGRAARKTIAPKSEAQADAGNYPKGTFACHGLQISIETRKGMKRRPAWKPLAHHYGYIRRTEGKDGDHVDVFVGPEPESEIVYVVDQVDPKTKSFDEHKCLIGFKTLKDAKEGYLACYEDGWKGLGKITVLTMPQFKEWLRDGSQKRPVSSQVFSMRKAAKDDDDKGDKEQPGILVLQRSTTIRFITPDEQPRDEDGKFESKEDLMKRVQNEFERLLEGFTEAKNGKRRRFQL